MKRFFLTAAVSLAVLGTAHAARQLKPLPLTAQELNGAEVVYLHLDPLGEPVLGSEVRGQLAELGLEFRCYDVYRASVEVRAAENLTQDGWGKVALVRGVVGLSLRPRAERVVGGH